MKNFYIGSLGAKLILAPLDMNRWRKFCVQTSTPAPSMHKKLTQHGKYGMQINQLLTKTLVDLKNQL
jgi:hypothetical protein